MHVMIMQRQHYLNCHSERKFKCFNCDKSYAIDWQLKYHIKTCGLIWKCLTCDKYYKERLSLITHCTRHSHLLPAEARRRKTKSQKASKESQSKDSQMDVMIFPVVMPQSNQFMTLPTVTQKPILPKPEIFHQTITIDTSKLVPTATIVKDNSVQTEATCKALPFV